MLMSMKKAYLFIFLFGVSSFKAVSGTDTNQPKLKEVEEISIEKGVASQKKMEGDYRRGYVFLGCRFHNI